MLNLKRELQQANLKDLENWRLEGSANLFIRGIKTQVNDIDIKVKKDILKKLSKRYNLPIIYHKNRRIWTLKKENLEFFSSSSHFTKEKIIWNEMVLYLQPLNSLYNFYKKRGSKKAELINNSSLNIFK